MRLKQEGDASSDEEEQLIAEASFQSDEPLAIDDSRLSDQDDSLIIKTSADSDEPTRSTLSLVVLNLAWIGLASNLVAWGIVMLPSQVRSSVGDEQDGIALAMIVLVGSLVTLVATPYIGLWSDRCTSRFGRRRPFMAIGLVVVVLAQLLLGAVNPDKPIEDTEDALCNITSTNSSSSNSSNSSSTVGQLASGEATTENKSFASSPQIWMLLVIYCFATLGYQVTFYLICLSCCLHSRPSVDRDAIQRPVSGQDPNKPARRQQRRHGLLQRRWQPIGFAAFIQMRMRSVSCSLC